MRNLIPLFLLLFAVSIHGQSFREQITKFEKGKDYQINYDKFKDITAIFSPGRDLKAAEGKRRPFVEIHTSLSFTGPELNTAGDKYLTLHFRSSSLEWRFLKSRGLIILADGERLDFGEGRRSSDINRNSRYSGVIERLTFDLSKENLQKLAQAKRVELQIGAVEARADGETIQIWKDFLTLID